MNDGSRYVEMGGGVPAPDAGTPPLPHLDIELTERCDNDCIHCCINRPEGDERARRDELSTSDIEQVLDEAAQLGTLTVRFTGGEPLLREDFADLYQYARRLGMVVIVFTNGRLITPELAELLAKVPPQAPVEVGVYGMTDDSSRAVTRRASAYAEARRGIALLHERGVPLVLKGVLLPATRDETGDFEAWSATLRSGDGPAPITTQLDLRLRRDSAARNAAIAALRASPAEIVRTQRRGGERYLSELRRLRGLIPGPPGDRLFVCGAGRDVCLDAYGVLQPCLLLRSPELTVPLRRDGGIEKGGLRRAVEDVYPRLADLRAGDPEYLRRCARCAIKGMCEQCPARSWIEHGTLDRPVEYLCEVAHAQARDAGILGEGELGWEVERWAMGESET